MQVYCAENASEQKVQKMQNLGAEVIRYGNDCGLAEVHAREVAKNEDKVFVSPYNDPDVMAG